MLIELDKLEDERGFFARAWCESDKYGPKIKFRGPALYVPQSLGMKARDLYQGHRRLAGKHQPVGQLLQRICGAGEGAGRLEGGL